MNQDYLNETKNFSLSGSFEGTTYPQSSQNTTGNREPVSTSDEKMETNPTNKDEVLLSQGTSNLSLERSEIGMIVETSAGIESQSKQETEKDRGPFVRLSGAARKRFKRLVAEGVDVQKAREMAAVKVGPVEIPRPPKHKSLPGDHRVQGEKRDRLENTIAPQADKKVKIDKKPSSSKIIKIGIVPNDFPNCTLSKEDFEEIKNDVLLLIIQKVDGPVKISFEGSPTLRTGWMIFYCSNEETANWLKSQELWTIKNLKAVDENNFPVGHVLVGYFPKSSGMSTDLIFQFIQNQNQDMEVNSWKILNRNDQGTLAMLAFEIGESSHTLLKQANFNIAYQFTKVQLKEKKRSDNEDANYNK